MTTDDEKTKAEKYDALGAIGELGGGPDDDNPFVNLNGTQKLILKQGIKNRQAEERLSAMGFETQQVEGARSTFCLEWMIDHVLSQSQRDMMKLAWAEHYGEILTTLEGKAREHLAAQQEAQRRAKLATPRTPSLIVPPGVRRPGG